MGGLLVLASRLLSVLRKPRLDEDLDVELGSHLQLLIEEKVRRAVVTSGLFSVLGARPVAGRLFLPSDDLPGAAPVVLVSERLWRERFNAAPDFVGKTITLNRQPFTVAGILPGDFQFPFETPPPDLWVPVQQDRNFRDLIPGRGGHYLSVIARLKSGVTRAQSEAELIGINFALIKQYPADDAGWAIRFAPLQHEIVGDAQLGLVVLLGAVAVVLLRRKPSLNPLVALRSE